MSSIKNKINTLSAAYLLIEFIILGISNIVLITGCHGKVNQSPEVVKHVDVETVYAYDVPYVVNYPALVQGLVDFLVVPRVSGMIYKKFYTEGSFVKRTQPLYEIDPRPYELQLQNYEGQLIKDKAAEDNLKIIYDRYVDLYKDFVVSKQDVETARINYKAAVGNVQTDIANIEQAKLNLLYCLVRSPMDGYISERQVTVGTMAVAYQTVLNRINSVDNLYLLFSMPENQRIELENGVLDKTIMVPKNLTFRLDIQLADGKIIPDAGYVEFSDTRISLVNGVWKMRGYVDNKTLKNKLLAGQFVNVYLRGIKYINVYTVPQIAVLHDDKGFFVYLLRNKQVVKQYVKLGKAIDESWIVTHGLRDFDVLITNGNLHINETTKVIVDKAVDGHTTRILNKITAPDIFRTKSETQEIIQENHFNSQIAKKIVNLNSSSSINIRGY